MLGIKENDKPIDIEYLVTALRNQLRLYPERSQFYAFRMPQVYNEMIKYYKLHPVEFMTDFITVNGKTIELTAKKYF
nr:MAG TPA: hypothetical protein [Caudoviricetes sp.]